MAVNPERLVELWERIDGKLNELPERIARALASRKTGVPGDDPGDPDYDQAGGAKRDLFGRFSKVHETLEPIYSDQKQFDAKKEWWASLGALTGVGAFAGVAKSMANQERFDRAKQAVWQSKQPPPLPRKKIPWTPEPNEYQPQISRPKWTDQIPIPTHTRGGALLPPRAPGDPNPSRPKSYKQRLPSGPRRLHAKSPGAGGAFNPVPRQSLLPMKAAPSSPQGALAGAEQAKKDEETEANTQATKELTTVTKEFVEVLKSSHEKFQSGGAAARSRRPSVTIPHDAPYHDLAMEQASSQNENPLGSVAKIAEMAG